MRFQANLALIVSTLAFTVCFACWVINGVVVAFLVNENIVDFTTSEVSWLIAVPILTGAVSRVPLGILTDRYGGRLTFFVLMLVTSIPLYLLAFAESFADFLLASLGFGLAGGGFAVGIAYVAAWFKREQQGTALGIFGMGNAGAALTTLAAPTALIWLTDDGADPERWRLLPQIYAGVLAATAALFLMLSRPRLVAASRQQTLHQQLAPLYSVRVWRFGLYYFLVFGAFVAIAQWLVPYGINVYRISIVQAGLIASLFSLPSGLIRAIGGWLSDRFGARAVMQWVFATCAISCAVLAVPRMDFDSPGRGVSARAGGTVTKVARDAVTVDVETYRLVPPPAESAAERDTGELVLPRIASWHEPVIAPGDRVAKGELLARGTTNIYYPANLWLFAALVFVFGIATGIGKAGVYKFIPDYFPNNVGTAGGMVGLLGALGGFVLPPLFGYALEATGLWSSCWLLLALLSLVCLAWMQRVVRGILNSEAPELARLVEFRPRTRLTEPIAGAHDATTVEDLLHRVPLFESLAREELKSLADIGHYETIAAGRELFREGDQGDTAYVILNGRIEVYRADTQGTRVVIARLGPGEVFGELSLIDRERRSAGAVAVEGCQLFVIARDLFIHLLATSPRLLGDFMVGMTERIRQTNAAFFDAVMRQERLRSEGEVERHRMITQMVTGVAHEINTPIGIATHAASIVSEQLNEAAIAAIAKDDEARRELRELAQAATLIQDNIRRADRLIGSFKNLSVHQLTEARETTDLADLTEEVVGLYKVKAEAARLDINVVNRLGVSAWLGYPGPYAQVVLNLLTNADMHAYPNADAGSIDFVLEDAGEAFRLSVRDHGIGIPEAELDNVFEPFFTTGRGRGGSGLGLAVVRNIVTGTLGGRIDIESNPGQGTTVRIEFPKTAPAHDASGGGHPATGTTE